MQTDEWMAYSCSSYFSDQISYITLFISSYSLGDMNFVRFDSQKKKNFVRFAKELNRRRDTGWYRAGPEQWIAACRTLGSEQVGGNTG
jgi:hypothetical protein